MGLPWVSQVLIFVTFIRLVYKARHRPTGKVVALKKIIEVAQEGVCTTALREINNLVQLRRVPGSQNIVSVEDIFFTKDGNLVLVFEYCSMDLSGLLAEQSLHLSLAQVKCILRQILEGVFTCHSLNLMHRDLKAANLLLTDKGVVKLADFGLMTNAKKKKLFSSNVVTLWYRAPELLLGCQQYGPEVDMWSVGCIFIELMTKKSPFPGKDEMHQAHLIWNVCGAPNDQSWPNWRKLPLANDPKFRPKQPFKRRLRDIFHRFPPDALDLLERMLTLDSSKRITASDALDHPFFWSPPDPVDPSKLPNFAVHEYEAKKKRRLFNDTHDVPFFSKTARQPPLPTTDINELKRAPLHVKRMQGLKRRRMEPNVWLFIQLAIKPASELDSFFLMLM